MSDYVTDEYLICHCSDAVKLGSHLFELPPLSHDLYEFTTSDAGYSSVTYGLDKGSK